MPLVETQLGLRPRSPRRCLVQRAINYVEEKVKEVLTRVVVAGQQIMAKSVQIIQAAGQAVQCIVTEAGKQLADIGNMLIDATLNAVKAFADKIAAFGRSITQLWDLAAKFLTKASAVIKAIVNDPGKFISNLFQGLKDGFTKFFENISTYLPAKLFSWLTSGLNLSDIQIPQQWNTQGVVTFLMQFFGLTWTNIQSILVKHIGADNIALITKAYEAVSKLIDLGPSGLYELLQQKLVNIKPEDLVNAAKSAGVNYVVTNVIPQIITKIAGLFNPFPVTLLMSLYSGLEWVLEQGQQMLTLANNVVDAIQSVLDGQTTVMANKVDLTLQELIVPVIDFVAKQVGLGNLPQTIGDVVSKVRGLVLTQIDKWVGIVVDKAKTALKSVLGTGTGKEGLVGQVITWTVNGETHQLWAAIQDGVAHVYVASNPTEASKEIQKLTTEASGNTEVNSRLQEGTGLDNQILGLENQIAAITKNVEKKVAGASLQQTNPLKAEVQSKLDQLGKDLAAAEEELANPGGRPYKDLSDQQLTSQIDSHPKNNDKKSPANLLRYERYLRSKGQDSKVNYNDWFEMSRGGRSGGPQHQAMQTTLKNLVSGSQTEVAFGDRVADVVWPDHNSQSGVPTIIQIGDVNPIRGDPIARERYAIQEIVWYLQVAKVECDGDGR